MGHFSSRVKVDGRDFGDGEGHVLAEHFVCPLDEIGDRSAVLTTVGDEVIGVLRVNNRLYAYENRCMHMGGPVCQGKILGRFEEVLDERRAVVAERFSEDEIHVVCPWHGWEYDVATGECTTDPKFRLRRYDTQVRDGGVYVVVP